MFKTFVSLLSGHASYMASVTFDGSTGTASGRTNNRIDIWSVLHLVVLQEHLQGEHIRELIYGQCYIWWFYRNSFRENK
jgi:hypothetical protein